MVKTRAQRELGFVTPSPKLAKAVQEPTTDGKNTAQKSSSGHVKNKESRRTRQNEASSETPRNSKRNRGGAISKKSQNSGRGSERKRSIRSDDETDKMEDEEEKMEATNLSDDIGNENVEKHTAKSDTRQDKSRRRSKTAPDYKKTNSGNIVIEGHDKHGDEDDEQDKEEEEEEEEEEQEEEHAEVELAEQGETGSEDILGEELEAQREDDDDDDGAPEDISFSTSRQEALESISNALQQSRRSDERVKEKRRNRDRLLKLQKERKKISLENSRLPDDFLSEVAKIPERQKSESQIVPSTQPPTTKMKGNRKVFDSDDDMDFEEGDDYIPLSSDGPQMVEGFEVRAISRERKAPTSKADNALDFLQRQLYGGKVKRESVNQHKSRLLKLEGKPGFVFLNPKEKRRKQKFRGIKRSTDASQQD